jgi:hypothetical protein
MSGVVDLLAAGVATMAFLSLFDCGGNDTRAFAMSFVGSWCGGGGKIMLFDWHVGSCVTVGAVHRAAAIVGAAIAQ